MLTANERMKGTELSTEGQIVVNDLKDLIQKTQALVVEKEATERITSMFGHARKAVELADTEALQGHTTHLRNQLSSSLVPMAKNLVTSSHFRTSMRALVDTLMELFKFYVGDIVAAVNDGTADIKETIKELGKGQVKVRDAMHEVLDATADTVEKMVPVPIQEQVAPQFSKAVGSGLTSSELKESASTLIDTAKDAGPPKELFDRLEHALKGFQQRPDFQKMIDDLFAGVDELIEHAKASKDRLSKGMDAMQDNAADREWDAATSEAKQLLEHIFNASLDPLASSLKVFFDDIIDDEDMLKWFNGWKEFIRVSLKEESASFHVNTKDLRTDQLNEKYRGHGEQVLSDLKSFLAGIKDDPSIQEFIGTIKKLGKDIFLNEHGDVTLKRDLLYDLAIALPELSERVAYIPLPRFEYEDSEYFLVLDDFILKFHGLLPTHIHVSTSAQIDLSIPEIFGNLSVNLSHLQVSAHGVSFQFRKKEGIVKWQDEGKVDFEVYDKGTKMLISGLTADIKLTPWAENGRNGFHKGFNLDRCDVVIHQLKLNLHDTENHNLIYKLLKPAIAATIRKHLSALISETLSDAIDPTTEVKTKGDSEITLGSGITALKL